MARDVNFLTTSFQSEGRPRGFSHRDVEAWHEISPLFALSTVSVDQNALCQGELSPCTSEHGLTLLIHKNLSRAGS